MRILGRKYIKLVTTRLWKYIWKYIKLVTTELVFLHTGKRNHCFASACKSDVLCIHFGISVIQTNVHRYSMLSLLAKTIDMWTLIAM